MQFMNVLKGLVGMMKNTATFRHMRADNLRSLRKSAGREVSAMWSRSTRAAEEVRASAPYIMTDSCLGRPVYINGRRCMIR